MGTWQSRFGRRVLLAVAASVVTLGLLEVSARLYVSTFANRERFSKYASLDEYRARIGTNVWWFGLLTPHRYLGFTGAPNLVDGKNRHNALGFRGDEIVVPKPDGEFRIACLGASTTYSLFVADYRLSYPALLQTELRSRGYSNVTVINAAVPAWSTYENLINYLLRVQDIEPDLVVFKEAFADLGCRLVWPPTAYKGDNSGCLAPQFGVRDMPFYNASTLLRILLVESGRALPASTLGESVYNHADTAYFFEFAKQRWGGRFPSGIFKTVSVADMLAANPPVYYRRNIENLVISAKEGGVQPVLATFPYSPKIGGYFDVEGFKTGLDEHNDILRQIAARFGVPLIDLATSFPTDTAYWGFDGIHANAEGTALEAKLVANFLVERHLVPK